MSSPGLAERPEHLARATAAVARIPTLEQVQAERCRRSLRAFVEQVWPIVEPTMDFVPNWHIDEIARHLEAVTRGEISRLLINIPPGCSKSLLVSVLWPAWEWTREPGLRYLTGSYSDSLTIRDNLRVRDIVTSSWYQRHFPEVRFREDQNQKIRMDTTRGGWRIATSVGGRATGEHPDRIVIDDPHSAKQSDSDVERQAALDWCDRTVSTRGVARKARVVVIMQRLHQRDLSGHLLQRGDDWTHICLPMRFEGDRMPATPLGWKDPRTAPGELLWPALFPAETLTQLERAMGSYAVAGQMQQRPAPAGGGLFKREWFRILPEVPRPKDVIARCRFWDCAGTEGGGDFTVGTRVAKCAGGRYIIEHVVRVQKSSGAVDDLMLQTAQSDGRAVRIREEQEPGSSGKAVVASRLKRLAGFDYKGTPSTGAKQVRWRPLAVQAEAGHIALLPGDWNLEWLDELAMVPFASHDDQADSAAGAFNELALGRSGGVSELGGL